MSLRGRYVIDRIKRAVGKYLKMPAPPYENPNYWENMYKSLGPSDVFEWGNLTLQDFRKYSYQLVDYQDPLDDGNLTQGKSKNVLVLGPSIDTTLGETLGVHPQTNKRHEEQNSNSNNNHEDEPIMVLGCGNSRFGEELLEQGWKGPIVQVDVAARVVDSMSQRCRNYLPNGDMVLLQDDATILSALNDNTVHAIFDKGLTDAIFCTDDVGQCRDILTTGHRVLCANGVFSVLSFSRPEFLLDRILLATPKNNNSTSTSSSHHPRRHMQQFLQLWSNIQIRKLDSIFLYRFVKAGTTQTQINKSRSRPQQQQKRRRR